jgi:hypothetical protein
MRHLRSFALSVAVLACFVPAQAFASAARIDGLGLQSDYIQDYVNVIHYPSTIVRYQNLVYGDLGIKDESGGDLAEFEDNGADVPALQNSARSMGAFLKLWQGMPGTFGVQLNENAGPISPAYGADFWNRNRNESFNLLWGDEIGSMAVGFQVNRSNSRAEAGDDVAAPFDYSPTGIIIPGVTNTRAIMNAINAGLGSDGRNSFGVGGGISFGWDGMGRHHTADVALQYRSLSLEQRSGAPGAAIILEDDGGMALAFNARSQFATSDNTYLTPVINYWTADMSTQFTDEATPANDVSYDNSVSGWNVGLAESWVLREQDLLTLGFAFGSESAEYDDPAPGGSPFDISYSTTPQIFGAAEIHPMSWFHVRLGASKSLMSKLEIEDTLAGTSVELKDSPFGYSLGAGFRIGGRLDLDAVINQDFAFTGGWVASGNEETPFSRLSATYRW